MVSRLKIIALLIASLCVGSGIYYFTINKKILHSDIDTSTPPSVEKWDELPTSVQEEHSKETFGKAVLDKDQPFEDKIKELLMLAEGDVFQGGFGGRKIIDLAAREKLFTDKGREEYRAYVIQQKDILDKNEHVTGRFIYKTQNYLQLPTGDWTFSANGIFCYGFFDYATCNKSFKINVVTKTLPEKIDHMIIDGWQVTFTSGKL